MKFSTPEAIEILERTPNVLSTMLNELSDNWVLQNEGPDTWSPFDIIGHLIHGEKTDWIVRAELILSDKTDKTFEPFDRFAQFENSKGKKLVQLLDEFAALRKQNLAKLKGFNLTEEKLNRTGSHPALGEATLRELLSTWVVHDLNHIVQISRVMARQYKDEVGPWIQYLGVLNK